MAAITPTTGNKKQPYQLPPLKIDMTPMVDLGFLLITFFIMTSTMSEPKAMEITFPKEERNSSPTLVKDSHAFTILLTQSGYYQYTGDFRQASATESIYYTEGYNTEQLRKALADRKAYLDKVAIDPEGKKGLMVMIKPVGDVAYGNLIKIMDEMLINDVSKYAVVQVQEEEIQFIRKY